MSQKEYFVYIMASRKGGALYIGVTSNLVARVWEHKSGHGSAHVARYKIHTLVYYGAFSNINDAIDNEKRIKRWKREFKNNLIEENNPNWEDLSNDF